MNDTDADDMPPASPRTKDDSALYTCSKNCRYAFIFITA